jgi:polyhydroxyalkanoate synthase
MSTFDPLDVAFRAGQELYKAGLLSLINARRQTRGRAPVGWPQVATTPADVLWQEGNARLLRYRRDTATRAKTPLLLVCSLINRPYVLDLLAERSVVRRLLDRGHDVWLLDWGTPTAADAARPIADYALEQLPRAAAVVTERAGSGQLHVLGYCMGGTLSLMAIAAGRLPAASLVAMATPVAMHDEGLLSLWCRAPGFNPDELAAAYGNVPPHVLQPAFKMLDPVSLATKFVHLDGKVEDDDFIRFFLAMETWLEDSVAFPGRAFVDWVQLYRSDALAKGQLALDGIAIDLGRVRCPLFHVVADGDYITPPPSSLALEGLTATRAQQTMRMTGGHIGLSTGRAAHEKLWPAVADWLHQYDAPAQQAAQPRAKMPVAARKVALPQARGNKRKR